MIPLFKFSSDEEAIQLANTTEYGLAAYFFTTDLARAWKVAEELEFGERALLRCAACHSRRAPRGPGDSPCGRKTAACLALHA